MRICHRLTGRSKTFNRQSVLFIWLNETNQMNQLDQTNQMDQSLAH
jgi:hypothetical protein